MATLIVGGVFDKNGGRRSSIITKLMGLIPECIVFNGGLQDQAY